VKERILIEKELYDEMGFLRQRLEPLGIQPTFLGVESNPLRKNRSGRCRGGQAEQTILLFMMPICLAPTTTSDAVQGSAKKLAIILLSRCLRRRIC